MMWNSLRVRNPDKRAAVEDLCDRIEALAEEVTDLLNEPEHTAVYRLMMASEALAAENAVRGS